MNYFLLKEMRGQNMIKVSLQSDINHVGKWLCYLMLSSIYSTLN